MSDIGETLDQLDRRLDDLRRDMAALTEDPQPASPPSPPPARRLEPLPPPPPELIAPPDARPEPDTAGHSGAPPAQHVDNQIQQLMTVRDQLLDGARELVRAYETQLDILEQMAASGVPAPSASEAQATASLRQTPSPVVPQEQARPVFYEGVVAVVVSGAHRVQTIQVLEDSLSRVRNAELVYVRRAHRGQVRLEVTLAAGTELLGEFNRVLPFPFAVTSATGEEIAVTIEGEQ